MHLFGQTLFILQCESFLFPSLFSSSCVSTLSVVNIKHTNVVCNLHITSTNREFFKRNAWKQFYVIARAFSLNRCEEWEEEKMKNKHEQQAKSLIEEQCDFMHAWDIYLRMHRDKRSCTSNDVMEQFSLSSRKSIHFHSALALKRTYL